MLKEKEQKNEANGNVGGKKEEWKKMSVRTNVRFFTLLIITGLIFFMALMLSVLVDLLYW